MGGEFLTELDEYGHGSLSLRTCHFLSGRYTRKSALQRLRLFSKVFGDSVRVRRDLFMVVGIDGQDLGKYATRATYTI